MSREDNISTGSEASQENTEGKDVKKTKKLKPAHIAIISLVVVLIAAGAVIMWFMLRDNQQEIGIDSLEVPGARGTLATPDNINEIRDQVSEPIDDSFYITRMNTDWVFDRWDEPSSNAFVENSEENLRTVYFDLHLVDSGELVYSSPFIPVGATLENFALDSQVPPGSHPAVVTYHLVDDNYENITTVSVSVTLIILE